MILYYSMSGNTEYVAKVAAEIIGEEAIDATCKIRIGERVLSSQNPFIIFAPVYYMNVPAEFLNYLKKCEFVGSNEAAIVLTATYSAGNAKGELCKILRSKGLKVGLTNVFYPPTSKILGLTYPNEERAKLLTERARKEVEHYATLFSKTLPIASVGSSLLGIIGTELGKFFQKNRSDKKFYVTDECDGCKICARICPRSNIVIENGKPTFGGNCNHCSGCINRCPKNAIQYGEKTLSRQRRKLVFTPDGSKEPFEE